MRHKPLILRSAPARRCMPWRFRYDLGILFFEWLTAAIAIDRLPSVSSLLPVGGLPDSHSSNRVLMPLIIIHQLPLRLGLETGRRSIHSHAPAHTRTSTTTFPLLMAACANSGLASRLWPNMRLIGNGFFPMMPPRYCVLKRRWESRSDASGSRWR
jgi:hypothetical protein